MKRLLLIPALAFALFACREKHATTTATPPAPDPNAYSTAPASGNVNVVTTENDAAEVVVPAGNNNTNSTDTVKVTVITTTITTTSDTVVTNVSMPEETTTGSAPADTTLCRLVVSFISKGAGIDLATRGQFDKWLAKDHAGFTFTTTQWGREGEVNYCFNLRAKSEAEQAAFVRDVRAFLDGKDLVLVNEWVVCDKRAATANETTNVTETTTADTNVVRLVVSFISKGEGIDIKTQTAFEQWLTNRGNVTWETAHWGREGETNYCFRLTNMSGRDQEIFVRDVRTFMTDKELVLVNEWAPCDKRR